MGKGDMKTKRGKITKGTYGVRRPKSHNKKVVAEAEVKEKPAKKAASKKKSSSKTT